MILEVNLHRLACGIQPDTEITMSCHSAEALSAPKMDGCGPSSLQCCFVLHTTLGTWTCHSLAWAWKWFLGGPPIGQGLTETSTSVLWDSQQSPTVLFLYRLWCFKLLGENSLFCRREEISRRAACVLLVIKITQDLFFQYIYFLVFLLNWPQRTIPEATDAIQDKRLFFWALFQTSRFLLNIAAHNPEVKCCCVPLLKAKTWVFVHLTSTVSICLRLGDHQNVTHFKGPGFVWERFLMLCSVSVLPGCLDWFPFPHQWE